MSVASEVLRALERRAAGNHRSAEAEAGVILIEAVSPYVRLGTMLTEIGAEIELTDEELAGPIAIGARRERLTSNDLIRSSAGSVGRGRHSPHYSESSR
ncbi:hypothetical protein AB0H42_35275 [Nocardia sp. NPDC050799]|uniref:FitA-like ribbon-helix-helix domain-containing protein n=1 Tax=Nocardia sp. NPDC050799 TaxID=3154842 RepID=UPI0033D01173